MSLHDKFDKREDMLLYDAFDAFVIVQNVTVLQRRTTTVTSRAISHSFPDRNAYFYTPFKGEKRPTLVVVVDLMHRR